MIDKLIEQIGRMKNPSVVGLDPTLSMMPDYLKEEMFDAFGKTPKAVGEMFTAFNKGIISAVSDIVPAVKPQIAMYEKFGLPGLQAYMDTVAFAREKGLVVIGDVKRGDISSTAEAYAAHIGGTDIEGEFLDLWQEDFVTINPYLGYDGIEPFAEAAERMKRGVFILVKTSNPGSGELQDIEASGMKNYERVAAMVDQRGRKYMGRLGFSRLGAVVGATHREQGEQLRKIMPNTFFLVPGYGAQGGKGADLKDFFNSEGMGCIVNSSRGITAAYKKDSKYASHNFADAAREAAMIMKKDLTF